MENAESINNEKYGQSKMIFLFQLTNCSVTRRGKHLVLTTFTD
jgi:hypothetical protein